MASAALCQTLPSTNIALSRMNDPWLTFAETCRTKRGMSLTEVSVLYSTYRLSKRFYKFSLSQIAQYALVSRATVERVLKKYRSLVVDWVSELGGLCSFVVSLGNLFRSQPSPLVLPKPGLRVHHADAGGVHQAEVPPAPAETTEHSSPPRRGFKTLKPVKTLKSALPGPVVSLANSAVNRGGDERGYRDRDRGGLGCAAGQKAGPDRTGQFFSFSPTQNQAASRHLPPGFEPCDVDDLPDDPAIMALFGGMFRGTC